jgi:asparagine synthase (glutamine-hydrolyzing)
MCGIAGQLKTKKCEKPIEKSELEKMLQIIEHRGPDGQGCFLDDDIAFGMRRLSIIDLENGWQPLYNEDKTVICCCNGEIYNYLELRKNLQERNHRFMTNSDCEVIVHLYEEKGINFINDLNGMFAFAIWDSKRKKLFLARDRMGKKPLYYMFCNEKIYFGSEIKSILVCSDVRRKANLQALDYTLTYNYIPNELTAFEGIYKLKSAQYIEIGIDGEKKIVSYWDVPLNDYNYKASEDKFLAEIESILQDAIKIRLRSDVPVGAFLSGGIDSSIVVGYASRFNKRMKTFSIGFEEQKYNELPYAKKVAQKFETEHIMEVVSSDFFSLLPKTIWMNDEPHGDVSFLPTYVLANLASQHVKTVLTGDGGDELFGGYDKYLNFIKNENWGYDTFFEKSSVFSQKDKERLYSKKFKSEINDSGCIEYITTLLNEKGIESRRNRESLNTLLYLEMKLLLDGNNLVKPDRMGMGNSMEARMPLLDYRLVEYIAKVPSEYKIHHGETKYILKKLAEKILPYDVVYRKKQMFTVPIGEWFKGSLKETAYKILLEEKTVSRGLFDYTMVKCMLDLHVEGKANYTRQIRLLIIIELWFRIYIDNFEKDFANREISIL